MSDQTELRMNLVAIKRVDPYAKDVVNSSAHVAFYTFNTEENEWEKTDIEGALFVYSRNAEPYHSIFINNRLNTNSLVEPITAQIELQSQAPFLLYRNERSRIRGFWFYNSSECDRIGDIIGRLIKECCNNLVNTSNNNVISKKSEIMKNNANKSQIDIFSMLTKAQEEFNNSTNQGIPPPKNEQPVIPQMTLNKTSSTAINIVQTTTVANNTPQSVMNFFAAAKQPAASEVPLFQRLLSNPVQTVEQIEKQHRTSTPSGKITPDVNEFENSFKFMSIPGQGTCGPELGTSPLATFLNSSNLNATRNVGQILKAKAVDVNEIESTQTPLHELLKKSEQHNISNNCSMNSNNLSTTPGKPALMPPTMFQSSASKYRINNMDVSVNNNNNHQHHPIPEPLTQNQLIQAIDYLIRNDPEFMKKLHEAYLKSFTEMVSQ